MDEMPGRYPPPPEPPPEAPPGPPMLGAGGRPTTLLPLSFDRVLQLTFSLFRFRWRALVGASLVIMVPAFVVIALAQTQVGDDLARAQQAQLDFAAGVPVGIADLIPLRLLLVNYLGVAVVGIAGYFAQGALVHLTAATFAGRRATVGEALRATLRRAPTLLGIALVFFVTMFLLTLLGALAGAGLIVVSASGGQIQPGPAVFAGLLVIVAMVALVLFIAVRWAFAVQAAMLEGLSAVKSLGRSWRLVSGSSWRVLGYSILFALLVGAIGTFVGALFASFTGSGMREIDGRVVFEPIAYLVASVIDGLISISLAPISVIGLTLLYFDVRFRRGESPLPGAVDTSAPPEAPAPGSVAE